MAIIWTKLIPRWGGDTIEPPEAKKDTGYIAGDKPPAKWENWLRKGTYEALDETRDIIEGIDSQLAQDALNLSNHIGAQGIDAHGLSGKIIHSAGSNANGNWIRFEDGTQICTTRRSVTSQNILVGSKIVDVWTFPSAFTTSPSVAGEINLFSNAGNPLSTSLKFMGNAAATDLIRSVAINAGADEYGSTGLTAASSVFTGIAIGRWK